MRRPELIRSMVLAAVMLGFGGWAGAALGTPSCPEVGFTIVEGRPSPETRPVKLGRTRTIQVRRDTLTRTSDITELKLQEHDHAALLLKFQPAAADRLEAATTNHDGLRLAFVANDEVLLLVTWQGQYGLDRQDAQVSMSDVARARQLYAQLRRCIGEPVAGSPGGR